jgi:hypothetical protein
MAQTVRVPTLAMQRQYKELQLICRALILEAIPEFEERDDFDDKVHEMIETIMTDMYEKHSQRDITYAIRIVKQAIDL